MKSVVSKIIEHLVLSLFSILLIVWTIWVPIFSYYLGVKPYSPSHVANITVILFISGILLWGWILALKKVLRDILYYCFDIGQAWGQYVTSIHFVEIGKELNDEMTEKGISLFDRALHLLEVFYKDNDFKRTGSHAEATSYLVYREFNEEGEIEEVGDNKREE